MSAYLLGFGFRADMGTRSRKLVLLKLIDACHDDGTRIYPAIASVARAAQCSDRQVQREIRTFVNTGLLRLVKTGGGGPGSTNEYALDLDALTAIAKDGWAAFAKGREPDNTADDDAENKGDMASPLGPENKGDTMSPIAAKGDTTDPLRVTPLTDKGDKLCHPTPYDPLRDPLVERERARASDEASEPADEDGLASFLAEWPTGSTDNVGRARSAWASLSRAERKAALDGIEDFITELRRAGRTKTPSASTYLGERKWALVQAAKPGAVDVSSRRMLQPWSRDWWIVLVRLAGAGQRRRVETMASLAVGGSGASCDVTELPTLVEIEGVVPVGSQTAEFTAWRVHFEERGIHIPRPERFAFMPSKLPPADHQAAE